MSQPAILAEELRLWLETAALLATPAALILAALQLSNVRRTVELQTNLAVMQAERAIWSLGLQNPAIAPGLVKERWGEPAGERLFAAMLLDHYEALYFQRRRGAIRGANWAPIERAMMEHIASPSIRRVWDAHRDLYWKDFTRFVEARLLDPAKQRP